MINRWFIVALGVAIAGPGELSAQPEPGLRLAQAAPKSRQAPRSEPQFDVEELTPSHIQRAQEPDRPGSGLNPPLSTFPNTFPNTVPDSIPKAAAPKAAPKAPAPAARAIACSG